MEFTKMDLDLIEKLEAQGLDHDSAVELVQIARRHGQIARMSKAKKALEEEL